MLYILGLLRVCIIERKQSLSYFFLAIILIISLAGSFDAVDHFISFLALVPNKKNTKIDIYHSFYFVHMVVLLLTKKPSFRGLFNPFFACI
jgi:hypothetical protein